MQAPCCNPTVLMNNKAMVSRKKLKMDSERLP